MSDSILASVRTCKICNIDKPLNLENFYNSSGGFTGYCRQCDVSPSKRSTVKRKAFGLCANCPNPASQWLCKECTVKLRIAGKKLRKKLTASGRCQVCRTDNSNGKVSCDDCLEKGRTANAARYRRRAADGYCPACGIRPISDTKSWCLECRASANQRARIRKQELLDAYGNKCACCSESQFEFLTIDHVNNDGADERRRLGNSQGKLYRQIKQQGFPNIYQLLCWNCNSAKGIYGSCPHTWKKE